MTAPAGRHRAPDTRPHRLAAATRTVTAAVVWSLTGRRLALTLLAVFTTAALGFAATGHQVECITFGFLAAVALIDALTWGWDQRPQVTR